MQLKAPQENYSRFTLKLKDKSLQNLYWDINQDEILFTMPYFTIMSGSLFLGILLTNVLEKPLLILVLAVEFLLYVSVHVLGNKYKNYHVYGVLLLFTVTQTNICINQFFFRIYEEQNQRDMSLRTSFEYLARTSAFFCLYAIPNVKWLGFYLLIYLLAIIALTL